MRTLFINDGPNADGNTAALACDEYTMTRFSGYYGMEYLGLVGNASEVRELAKKL